MSFRIGHDRVDADDEVGTVLDGQVDVGGLLDAAVHVVPSVDAHRPVEAGQGGRGLHRPGDRDVAVALGRRRPRPAPLSRSTATTKSSPRQILEAVGTAARAEEIVQVLLDPRSRRGGRGEGARRGTRRGPTRLRPSPVRVRDERLGEDAGGLHRALQELEGAQAVEGGRGHPEGRVRCAM